jgi:hypothetical protein
MNPDDDRFVDRVWLPMWEGTQGTKRPRHARRLLQVFGTAIAEHIRDTSDAPRADWRQYHQLAGLPVPPMP